jgi:hypothetical protein
VKFPQSRVKAFRNELQAWPGLIGGRRVFRGAAPSRGEAAVQLRLTRSESGVSSVAAAPRSSCCISGRGQRICQGLDVSGVVSTAGNGVEPQSNATIRTPRGVGRLFDSLKLWA